MSRERGAEIRLANASDAEAVRECVRAAYSKYVERIGKDPAPMTGDYESLARAGEVWVLAEGNEAFGSLVMREGGDHLFVENVAVSPDRQGRGFGRTLMAFAEKKAEESSLPEIRLYTNEKMWENLAFYEKLGFEETGRCLDGGYRRVFMRKKVR